MGAECRVGFECEEMLRDEDENLSEDNSNHCCVYIGNPVDLRTMMDVEDKRTIEWR